MQLWNNIRFALRLLRKSPAFTVTVLATLGLCIGANTAIYSVVDALFFRPLPYPHGDRLVTVATLTTGNGADRFDTGQGGQAWRLIQNNATYITPAIYGENNGVNLYRNGQTAYVQQQRIGANFFHVLGIPPLLGREWKPNEDIPHGPNLTVLSYNDWQRFFHGNPNAIGQTVDLRGAPYTVIGVMPQGFHTDTAADLWTPLQPTITDEGNYQIIGRLKSGVILAAATGQLNAVLQPAFHDLHLPANGSIQAKAVPLETAQAIDNRTGTNLHRQAILLASAAGLILLIGCINIAGLLLSRSVHRRREIATRLALGASRGAVVRQLLAESLLLAIGGGLLGLLVGNLASEGLAWLSANQFNFWNPVHFDLRVGFVSFAIALLTGLLFGLFPAIHATNVDLRSGLAEASRTSAGIRSEWLGKALVFAEVTLGVTVVISAGLLLRTFLNLMTASPGFVSQNVVAASLTLDDARYKNPVVVDRLFRDTLSRINQIRGVQSASVTLTTPYQRALQVGVQTKVPGWNAMTDISYATPGLFGTLQISLLRGRDFTGADGPDSLKVIVVNAAFVHRFFPNDPTPLGKEIKLFGGLSYRIIGIVGNVLQKNSWGGPFGPVAPLPQAYIPISQFPTGTFDFANAFFSPNFVVRTYGHIAGLDHAMQQAIARVDPRLPFSKFQDMNQVRGASLSEQRYLAVLFSTLACLALLLSAIGVYGLIAQSVAQRTREMGIRLALGATANNIVRQASTPGIVLATLGVACGLVLSFFATRLLTSVLWGISATDPLTYLAVAILLIGIAALASLIPALRLTRIDPAQTLRDE